MATRTWPFVTTGVVLAGAAAVVAAAPASLSGTGFALAGVPTPVTISTAKLELTALSDITIQGINDAYWFGWGGYIGTANGTPDVYYPNINPTGKSPVYVTGASGAAYYLIDEALSQFGSINLDNYFFEVGSTYGGKSAPGSGVSALIYVGASEFFGATSPIAQLAKTIFYYGVPNITNATIVQLASRLPTAYIGPVKVGGGILASLYFTGQTPDGSFDYGSSGLSAVAGYIATSITDALPAAATGAAHSTAGNVLAASTRTSPTATTKVTSTTTDITKSTVGDVKIEAAPTTNATSTTKITSTATNNTASASTPNNGATASNSLTPASPNAAAAAKTTTGGPLSKIANKISAALGTAKPTSARSTSGSSSGRG